MAMKLSVALLNVGKHNISSPVSMRFSNLETDQVV